MARVRVARRVSCGILAWGIASLAAPSARAFEAMDGRVQAHGYGEMQIRMISQNMRHQADLTQWYNVLNLELEFDILPDGLGPIDLLQAYVRIEGRYDCVWTHGCGMIPPADFVGNQPGTQPSRLRNGEDQNWAGTIFLDKLPDSTVRPENHKPIPLSEVPGFTTIFEQFGPDANQGEAGGPANYTFYQGKYSFKNFRWNLARNTGGPDGGGGKISTLGPWLPENKLVETATLSDRANPFRGKTSPMGDVRAPFTAFGLPVPAGAIDDPLDPRIALQLSATTPINQPGTAFNAAPSSLVPTATFGGDFSGLIPISAPSEPEDTGPGVGPADEDNPDGRSMINERRYDGINCVFNRTSPPTNCSVLGPVVPGNANFIPEPLPGGNFETTGSFSNIRIVGGGGELPMRTAPDMSNLSKLDRKTAQGIYYPSRGLVSNLDDIDDHDFNGSQSNRSWNFGASQKREQYVLKEAYFDVETDDSRIWGRFGKQNTVWGKTELFRTTDQFNPQDLALASLPSLEESRIALWGGRIVYSLYDVGPLEDVRLEFAFNFDHVEPSDLGYCGEAYTPNVVCNITNGIWAHGVTGVGVAGQDRPPNPWDSLKGLEVGGRVEWRWDRFSFAVVDFWGYNDFPYPDRIHTYSRDVDLMSGRPRVVNAKGNCSTAGQGPATVNGDFLGTPVAVDNTRFQDYGDPKNPFASNPNGIGVDPSCLQGGGAFDDPTRNALQYHHANQQLFAMICNGTIGISNLDFSACAQTIFGSRAALQQGAISTPLVEVISSSLAGEPDIGPALWRTVLNFDFQSPATGVFFPTIAANRDQNDGVITSGDTAINVNVNPVPAVTPVAPGTLAQAASCASAGPPANRNLADPYNCRFKYDPGYLHSLYNGTFNNFDQTPHCQNGGDSQSDADQTDCQGDYLTLDSVLTNQQKALLGCGPYYGTRCDSSDAIASVNGPAIADIYGNFTFGANFGQFPQGGGVDVLNMEASVLYQSWLGFEGTDGTYTTTDTKQLPGTIGFVGGPVATRDGGNGNLTKLPGSRGADSTATLANWSSSAPTSTNLNLTFENGYDPSVDGCITAVSGDAAVDAYCQNSNTRAFFNADPSGTGGESYSPSQAPDGGTAGLVPMAGTLYHVTAGCSDPALNSVYGAGAVGSGGFIFDTDTGACDWLGRDFDLELDTLGPQTVQIMQNELAVVSYNFLMFLASATCLRDVQQDIIDDPECFDPTSPESRWSPDRCSWTAPQLCSNVSGFFALAGLQRNDVRAGGNAKYGRRTFIWHSGGEVVLRYQKRNVFGISTDFAEDVTKSNWGAEFTWVKGVHMGNGNSYDGISDSDVLNLTVSVDRPTFINFLNANRTFFFNSQWFFQYVTGRNDGYGGHGPWNVLFTFAVQTGYFQDRLLPSLVTVYDFRSQSGAILPTLTYRFTEAFSVSIGMAQFFGRGERDTMGINPIAPSSNRVGSHAYTEGVENGLSLVRARDEAFMEIRWTF